ncbi:MAG: ferredoxin [Kiritimatiellaeota bacterium]|nr:ferredoxin [Kiritimatiellota bacterium]
MKATVDAGMCTGCELCVSVCPEVFEMDNNVAKAKADVPAAAEAACKEAAESCPVTCITVA